MATAPPPSYVAEWKRTSPPAIQSAVEFLRKTFTDRVRVAKFSTRGWCFHALHPDASEDFERLLKPGAVSDYLDSLLPENSDIPEPAIFQRYFYACADLIAPNVRATFLELLGIARAHPQSLKCAPVEWASSQMNLLIEEESSSIGMWSKHACDQQNTDELDEAVYWNNWRAPGWLFMKPFANSPYDRARAWERKDESETQHVLRVIRDRFNIHLTVELQKLVGEAHVQLAKDGHSLHVDPGAQTNIAKERAVPQALKIRDQYRVPNLESNANALTATVNRKLSDPSKYPILNPREVMCALSLSKSAVYEHKDLERSSTGNRAVRFTTASVLAVKNSSPE